MTIRENGFVFEAGLAGGQKTGFYLDQRENRRKVAAYARGRDVLSAYCYTGAFEVCAAHAGAKSIRCIALAWMGLTASLNCKPPERLTSAVSP